MTLIIARKTITAVFGTVTLQLIEAFQSSVTYSIKNIAVGEQSSWGGDDESARMSKPKYFQTNLNFPLFSHRIRVVSKKGLHQNSVPE